MSNIGFVFLATLGKERPRARAQIPTGPASPGSSNWTGCALLMPTGPSERRSSLSGFSQLPTRTARLTAMFAAKQYSPAALGGAAIEPKSAHHCGDLMSSSGRCLKCSLTAFNSEAIVS